jgi:hypothetical protein
MARGGHWSPFRDAPLAVKPLSEVGLFMARPGGT